MTQAERWTSISKENYFLEAPKIVCWNMSMHVGAYAILQTKESIFSNWARREMVEMRSRNLNCKKKTVLLKFFVIKYVSLNDIVIRLMTGT